MRLDRFTLRVRKLFRLLSSWRNETRTNRLNRSTCWPAMLEQPEGIVRPILGKPRSTCTVVSNDVQAAIARFPRVQGGQQYFSPRLKSGLHRRAKAGRVEMQDEFISTEHLLLAIADEKDGEAGKLLRQHGVKRDDLLKVIEQMRGGSRITDQNAEAELSGAIEVRARSD